MNETLPQSYSPSSVSFYQSLFSEILTGDGVLNSLLPWRKSSTPPLSHSILPVYLTLPEYSLLFTIYRKSRRCILPYDAFHSEDMADFLQKVDPNESVSLDRFAFMRWYVENEASLDSSEESESLVG